MKKVIKYPFIIMILFGVSIELCSGQTNVQTNQKTTPEPRVTDIVKPKPTKSTQTMESTVTQATEIKKVQSLEEINSIISEKLKNAKELLNQADIAYQNGEYDRGYELAEKAKQIAAEIENLNLNKRAILKIDEAKEIIARAEEMESQKYAPEELANAKSSLLSAQNFLEAERFNDSIKSAEDSINYAKASITKIEKIKKREEEAKLAKKEEIPAQKEPLKQKGIYKIMKTYTVRLIPERRDCLWRIAEYKFIYGDPWKWPIIYKANKDQIKDPDLIYPGQVFDIPELDKNGNPVLLQEITEEQKIIKEVKEEKKEVQKPIKPSEPSEEEKGQKEKAETREQPPFEKETPQKQNK